MLNETGSQYKIVHSKSLLELLQKITSNKQVSELNQGIRGESNSIKGDGTALDSTHIEILPNNEQIQKTDL